VAFLASKALDFRNRQALHAHARQASLTSSSLKGLIMASIFFMGVVRETDTNNRDGGVNRNLKNIEKKDEIILNVFF
jgi:hypothetical protein